MNAQLLNPSPVRFDYASGICSGGCTDIDMMWERRGRFLVIENKQPGEEISLGQLITLRALNALEAFQVWVVFGFPPNDVISFGPLDGGQYPVGIDELRHHIQAWWDSSAL